ncbi:MAG: AraC family transcriptional regulator [Leeuwenhoekiella sp.]
MTYLLNYEPEMLCKLFLQKQLDDVGIPYSLNSHKEIVLDKDANTKKIQGLIQKFRDYGIAMFKENEMALVEQIKMAIDDIILNNAAESKKISVYLSERLNYSYAYLALHFSEHTHNSIEKFIILRKVELVKNLMLKNDFSLTEISYKLNYSSVAHLSRQFKKVTGLTPTTFKKIMNTRNLRKTSL